MPNLGWYVVECQHNISRCTGIHHAERKDVADRLLKLLEPNPHGRRLELRQPADDNWVLWDQDIRYWRQANWPHGNRIGDIEPNRCRSLSLGAMELERSILADESETVAVAPGAIDRAAERADEVTPARVFGGGDANGHTKPPALPAGVDESAGPALTVNQSRVLQTMALFDASRLLSSKMIAEEMNAITRLSEETVRQSVGRLIESKLAERPEGDRSGARLTTVGRKLAGKIAD